MAAGVRDRSRTALSLGAAQAVRINRCGWHQSQRSSMLGVMKWLRVYAWMPVLLGAALLLLAGGCQGLGLFLDKPGAEVTSVELEEQTEQGGRVVATVRLANPNDVVLPVAKAHYTVQVEGAERFRFTTVPSVAMPAKGGQTVTLPAAFKRDGGRSLAGRAYTVDGHVTYRPAGEVEAVLFGSGWPLPRTGFHREGTLGAPGAAPGGTTRPAGTQGTQPE
jgi:LEA14-like dessication related protein